MAWYSASVTCVGAYDAIGASSLADSYVNEANPGTYDLIAGNAPGWTSGVGWQFVASSSHYLRTGITPTNGYSVVIRMSDLVSRDAWALGNYASNGWGIQANQVDNDTIYYNGNTRTITLSAPGRVSGVWCLAGGQGYYNGSADGASFTPTAGPSAEIYIGDISGEYRRYLTGNVQALAIYSNILTSGDVATVTAAMNALTAAVGGYPWGRRATGIWSPGRA